MNKSKLIETLKIMAEINADSENRSIVKSSMSVMIRKICDKVDVNFVSEAAKKRADKDGINLFEYNWKDQSKFDKGRSVFHLEHKYPVSDMVEAIFNNPEDTDKIINNIEFGWILKDEDKELKRYNRKDHSLEYKNAGIKLIHKS